MKNKFRVVMSVTVYALLTAQELAARLKIGLSNERGGYLDVKKHLENFQVSLWSVERDPSSEAQDEDNMKAYIFGTDLSFETQLTEQQVNDRLVVYFGKQYAADGLTDKDKNIIAEITDYVEWQVIAETATDSEG